MTTTPKHLLFFVNPKSGGRKKTGFEHELQTHLDRKKITYDLVYWNHIEFELASIQSKIDKADILVAVGGDGTVNYLGNICIRENKTLAVIPMGSGNGLARHLGIPLQMKEAVLSLNAASEHPVDVISVNNRWCFNICGIGFDAYVAHHYKHAASRGFMGYAYHILKALFSFKPRKYHIETDGMVADDDCYIMGVANGSQWGYGFTVNTNGKIDDGQMEYYVIRNPGIFNIPSILWYSFRSKLHLHPAVELRTIEHLKVGCSKPIQIHIDGEPYTCGNEIELNLEKEAIKMYY
jgi:YegS/Rv2252/BmrU family lipid kinase